MKAFPKADDTLDSTTPIDQALAFHQQLLALDKIGLPVDIGDIHSDSHEAAGNEPDRSLSEALYVIQMQLSARHQAASTIDSICTDTQLPRQYRLALRSWVGNDDPTVTFNAVTQAGREHRRLGADLSRTLAYPLLIFALVFFGTIFFCLYLLPRLTRVYQDMESTETTSVIVLQALGKWMPVWAIVVPLVVLAVVAVWRSNVHRLRWGWVPGTQRYFDLRRGARYADQMASLIESGATTDEATALVLTPGFAERLPLLKWAIGANVNSQSDGSQPDGSQPDGLQSGDLQSGDLQDGDAQIGALRTVAKLYGRFADHRSRFWRFALPSTIGVFLGGLLVLAYGLALFLPFTELLQRLFPGGS